MEWLKKIPGGVWGVLIITLFAAAFWPGRKENISPVVAEQVEKAATSRDNRILIHVSGAVAHPGIYQLPPDSRAQDAVAAAGGFLPEADESRVNLAKRLKDGMQVRVPLAKNAGSGRRRSSAADNSQIGPNHSGGVAESELAENSGRQLVSLNHGNEQELCSLPGVGPATARRIIAYRTAHGSFAGIDDLLAVSGIGPHKLAELKPFVTLD